jgi:hypothetical protein
MSEGNGRVIHAEDEFQPVPQDDEAVAVAASDALRRVAALAAQVDKVEAGETEWQVGVDKLLMQLVHGQTDLRVVLGRVEANLSMLIQHCKGRTATCNQAGSTPPPPDDEVDIG